MKTKMLFLSLLNLLCVSTVYSYIYKVSQLKNHETGQRIVLYSDIHHGPNWIVSKNKSQKEVMLSQIDKVADDADYLVISERFDEEFCKSISKAKAGKKCLVKLPMFVDLALNNNYKGKINFADKIRHSNSLFKKFKFDTVSECLKFKKTSPILCRIERLLNGDFSLETQCSFMKELSNLNDSKLIDYKANLDNEVIKDMKSCIEFFEFELNRTLVFNKKLYKEVKAYIFKLKSCYKSLSWLSFMLLVCDLEMIFSIYRANKTPNIILFAGGLHTDNIEKVLINSGYIKEFSSGLKIKNFECNTAYEALENILNYASNKFDQTKISKFINSPKHNLLSSNYVIYICVLLKIIYESFINNKKNLTEVEVVPLKDEVFNLISEDNLVK